jgi:hypothetical protein
VSITFAQVLSQGFARNFHNDIEGSREADCSPMKSKYLDLRTGEVISANQLLAFEKGKSEIWEMTDELYSLLADIADAKEEEAHSLLWEVETIRALLKKYRSAEDSLGN